MTEESPNPTPGEMELLGLLWEHGPMSLSEVFERLGRNIGYTTVQTRLNRLVDKGLATREKTGRQPTKYAAAVAEEEVGASHLDALLERMTRGSVVPLVAHLMKTTSLTDDELTEIRDLIDQAERRSRRQKRKGSP